MSSVTPPRLGWVAVGEGGIITMGQTGRPPSRVTVMEPQSIIREVGEWTNDESVRRGVMVVAGTIAAVMFAAYRWLRRPKRRSRIHIDCEPGEKVLVQLGEDDEEGDS